MKCQKLSSDANISKLIEKIGSEKTGQIIMSEKAQMLYFYIKDLKTPGANILKQEALSLGAEFAVPRGVITCESEFVDGVLMVSKRSARVLVEKLKSQQFGLKSLSHEILNFIDVKEFKPKIMGVLNVNEDSFFQGSRFVGDEAVKRVEQMIENGADMIDVGGVSSRPGSEGVSPEEELKRVSPIIDAIYKNGLHEKATFSLDSYEPLPLKYALDRGFKIVNDIQGLQNDEVAKLAGEYNATVCIMHMQNDPKTMQKEPFYEDVIDEIDSFFAKRIEKAKSFGVKDIILDVGIGFGKTLEHNLTLIKHQSHFLHFGYELLVGASRKSMIDNITKASIEERLPGTLIIHTEALRQGASIIRCHDVKEHFQAIKVYEAFKECV